MTMLDAAIAIRRGDWSSALALLSRGPQGQEMALLHVLTRLRARANVGAEHVADLPGRLGVVLMAWSRALRGQIDLDELASTVTEDGVRAEAAPLRGWLRLQETHRVASRSDPALGIAALQEVGQLWPDISELLDEEDWQAQLLMLLPVRPAEAREVIDGSNTVVGDPATCHRIALCWLSEAARHWDARDWRAAVTALERSLSHWAVALCDERWVQSWLDTRAQVWQRSADFDAAADLRARFVKYVERLATLWSAELVHSDAMLAESLQLAPMLWEAECHAARRMAELGGLPLEDGRKIIAGPGYLHEKNLEEVFQSFVSDVQIPGEWSDDMREIMRLLDMSASEFGESPETESSRKDLRLRFSPMRVACALERNGEIERAIARLRGVLSLPCVSIDDEDWTLEHTDAGFDSMSDEEEYATAAGNLLVEWLVKKGEQAVAKGGDALQDGMEAWREAILLADEQDADGDNIPRQRIPRSVMGRCDVLAKAKRLEEGRELLERGMELLPHDEHLRSMLANFYVNAGVDIANEKSDWDQSLVWLRKAHKLAPDLPRVMRNVALCLHMSAKAKLDSGKARAAVGMFKEAADIAMRCLRVDRNDEEMRNVHASSNNGYLEASMRDGGLTGIDNVLEALMTSNAGGQRTLSTKYHNEAVQKANAGRWREAIELFEKALIYEPDSEATKKMLAQSLMGQINELMGRLAPVEEILPLVRRAASLDPHNPFIRLLDSTL